MNLFKSISVYAFSNIARQAVGFVLIPIITTYLSTSENGDLSTITAIVTLIGPLIYLSAHSAINIEFFRKDFGEENYSHYVSSSLVNPILISLSLTFIAVLFSPYLASWLEISEQWLMLVPFLCFVNVIPFFTSTLFQAQKLPINHSFYNIGLTVFDLGLSIFLIAGMAMKWEGRVLAMMSSKLVFSIIGFYLIWRSGFISKKISKAFVKDAFFYGLPLIPHIMAAGVMDFSDRIFIRKMVGSEELGVYDIGYKIGSIILVIQASLLMAWIPFLFEKLKEINHRNKIYIISVSYLMMIGLVICGILLTLFAPLLFDWFIGEEYAEGIIYVGWVALAYVFLGFYKMFSSYILYFKKNIVLSYIAVFNIVCNVLLNYFLINKYGTIGAAYATAISYFLFFLVTAVVSHRIYPLPWLNVKEVYRFIKMKAKGQEF